MRQPSIIFYLAVLVSCSLAAYEDSQAAADESGPYPYPAHSKPEKEFKTGYIIPCEGRDELCVPSDECQSGYIPEYLLKNFQNEQQKCLYGSEVCCTIKKTETGDSNNVISIAQPGPGYLPVRPDEDASGTGQRPNVILPPAPTTTLPPPTPPRPSPPRLVEPIAEGSAILGPQIGCAAALLCVEEQFCDAAGNIVKSPITLTEEQILRRVPIVDCRNPETGNLGKCCRDPDYVDPWPAGNLPADYKGGFDEQGFPRYLNISRLNIKPAGVFTKPVTRRPDIIPQQSGFESVKLGARPQIVTQRPIIQSFVQTGPNQIPSVQRPRVIVSTQRPVVFAQTFEAVPEKSESVVLVQETAEQSNNGGLDNGEFSGVPAPENILIGESRGESSGVHKLFAGAPSTNVADFITPHQPGARCGLLNKVHRAHGLPNDTAAFGEIPWQAMILDNVEKKLLCSGVIVAPNVVLTAANCVYGKVPSTVSVKAGEWKLGYELKHEEPLNFQIVAVQSVIVHPGFQVGLPSNDLAMLFLEKPFVLDQHIDVICLKNFESFEIMTEKRCISTGWGKEVIRLHAPGALMNRIDVDILSEGECRSRIENAESLVDLDDSLICAKAHKENNNMCQVDLGGPLTCDRGDGYWELVGVYSADTGCLPINQVATFARIDIQWITSILEAPQVITQSFAPNSGTPISVEYVSSSTAAPTMFIQSSPQYIQSTTVRLQPIPTTQQPPLIHSTTSAPLHPLFIQSSTTKLPEQQYIQVTTGNIPNYQPLQTTTLRPLPIVVQEQKTQTIIQTPKNLIVPNHRGHIRYQYNQQGQKAEAHSFAQNAGVQKNYIIQQQRPTTIPLHQTQYIHYQQKTQPTVAPVQRETQYLQKTVYQPLVAQQSTDRRNYVVAEAEAEAAAYRPQGPITLGKYFKSLEEKPSTDAHVPEECPCKKNKQKSQHLTSSVQ